MAIDKHDLIFMTCEKEKLSPLETDSTRVYLYIYTHMCGTPHTRTNLVALHTPTVEKESASSCLESLPPSPFFQHPLTPISKSL